MKQIESFLKGHMYPLIIILIGFLIWSYKYYIPSEALLSVSFYSLFLLSIPFFLISYFFKNSVYTIPIILVMLFSLGIPDMGLDTFDVALTGFISIFLIILGFIVHLIKFKVKLKLKTIGLSLALAAISFFIPVIYSPFAPVGVMLSLLGALYFLIFLYYANTIEGNQLHYLMRVFALLGLMLSFQIVSIWFVGLSTYTGTNIIADFINIFPSSELGLPGWGNMNDLTIHLVLFTSVVIYYLHKYPKHIFPWLFLGWVGFWIYVSNARGSMVTITLAALGTILYAIFKRNKRQLINLAISVVLAIILLIVLEPLVKQVFDSFFNTIDFNDPNTMLTGRITLWIEHEASALNEFLRNPIFGTGWYNERFILAPGENRITIYHSTFFQVLATGGIVGIMILIYHFICVFKLFKTHIKYKAVSALMFTYLLSQLHGLMDNTQYMLHFSVVTYIAFAVIENIPKSDDETLLNT